MPVSSCVQAAFERQGETDTASASPALPVLALPPGRASRILAMRRAAEAARDHDESVQALPEGHRTMPSGHPIFARWLLCHAARSGL